LLLISILLWCLVVYSFRITVFGNPRLTRVREMPEDAVRFLDHALEEGRDNRKEVHFSPKESAFIRSFVHNIFLEMAAFPAEIGLLLFLWHARVLPGLCIGLLIKDLLVVVLGIVQVKKTDRDTGFFVTVRALPMWAVTVDRVSQAISGAGFALLFLAVNGFLPGLSQ